MEDTRPAHLSTAVRGLAIFLMVGGLWGLVSLAWPGITFQLRPAVVVDVDVPLLTWMVFSLTAAAGALLWAATRIGIALSLVVVAAQTVHFHITDGLGARFVTGASVNVAFRDDLRLNWSVGSAIDVRSAPGAGSFGINLVGAIALVILISHVRWLKVVDELRD
jgi:hypothetical protein